MGLNIKNPKTQRLIKKLAGITGEGQTEAVTRAVEERLERVNESTKRRDRLRRILAIAKETAPLLKDLDMDEVLYGENGLYDRDTGLPK